ncbi:hypothetical protein BJX70DRAFT_354728 [Aspergillus crustosus]
MSCSSESSDSVFTRETSCSTDPSMDSFSSELPLRQAASPVESQGSFMFINSQADNPQNLALQKEKQSFVLNKYFRRKRQAAIDRLKPSKPLSSARPRLPHTHADAYPASAERNQTEEEVEDTEHILHRTNHVSPGHRARRPRTDPLTAYLAQGNTDPFSASSADITNQLHAYFHHYKAYTIPAFYPLDAQRACLWLMQKATPHPTLLNALLFLAAYHRSLLESGSGLSPQLARISMQDSIRLRIDTLQRLKDIMQDPSTAVVESTAYSIGALVIIEAVSASFDALDAHKSGLKRLIHLLGGLETFDHRLLSKLYLGDAKSAALNNTQPSFPIIPKWRNAILQHPKTFQITGQEDINIPEALSSLGISIFNSTWYEELDKSMKVLLRVLFRLIIYYETAVRNPSSVTPTDNDLYILFEHQLVSIKFDQTNTIANNPDISETELQNENQEPLPLDLNESLRITLLVYTNLRLWHLQAFPFMQYIAESLKQNLSIHLLQIQTTASPDLLFWMLFIGGLASQGYNSHSWFVSKLIVTTESLQITTWEEARWILDGFFYTDQEDEKKAEEALWNEILAKQACESHLFSSLHIQILK